MSISIAGVRAVAFDLDDTLTDWTTGIANAAAAVGDPEILERVRADTWVRRDGIVVDRHHWRVLHEPASFMAVELTEPFLAALDPPLFDDVLPTLDALRGRVALALMTNNPFGADVLLRHGLHADVFDAVVVADPLVRKPNPLAFAPILATLDLEPDEVAYVGDTVIADVEGSLAAGLRAVWLDRWRDPWVPPEGVVRIASLIELTERLEPC
jgi:HAD superfamily hydrolase (TIGR01549 family)